MIVYLAIAPDNNADQAQVNGMLVVQGRLTTAQNSIAPPAKAIII